MWRCASASLRAAAAAASSSSDGGGGAGAGFAIFFLDFGAFVDALDAPLAVPPLLLLLLFEVLGIAPGAAPPAAAAFVARAAEPDGDGFPLMRRG